MSDDVKDEGLRDDDVDLLRALDAAFAGLPPVPALLSEFARSAIDWADLDAEVSRLTFDSALELQSGLGLRSGGADERALSYEGADLEIEVTLLRAMAIGQISPAATYSVALQTRSGRAETSTDERGRFRFPPFRLPARLVVGGRDGRIVTPWLTA